MHKNVKLSSLGCGNKMCLGLVTLLHSYEYNKVQAKPGAVWQCDPRAPGSWVDPRVQARWCDALLPPWRPWRPAPPREMSLAGSQSLVPNTSLAGVPVGRNATAAQSQHGRHLCVSNLHSGLGQHKRVYPGSPAAATHPHTRMGCGMNPAI